MGLCAYTICEMDAGVLTQIKLKISGDRKMGKGLIKMHSHTNAEILFMIVFFGFL